MKKLPKEVYLIVTELTEGEKARGSYRRPPRPARMYSAIGYVKQFLHANRNRSYKLYKATVVWEEVEV